MTFLFAYLASVSEPKGWPIHLMHRTEAVFVGVALVCFLIAVCVTSIPAWLKAVIAVVGGIGAGFGLVMPFELAPFFFGSKGEVMMASILLNLVYPIAIILFILFFSKLMNPTRKS